MLARQSQPVHTLRSFSAALPLVAAACDGVDLADQEPPQGAYEAAHHDPDAPSPELRDDPADPVAGLRPCASANDCAEFCECADHVCIPYAPDVDFGPPNPPVGQAYCDTPPHLACMDPSARGGQVAPVDPAVAMPASACSARVYYIHAT